MIPARLGLLACLALATTPASADATGVETLGWLTGCWSRTDLDAGSGEQWMAPGGGTMLGMSRTVQDGRTVEYEFVVIRPAPDGTLVYHAHPSGQASAEFRLVRTAEHEVIFENVAHDFPQRIGYRLDPDGTLKAWIEGRRNGTTRRVSLPMRRAPCATVTAPPARSAS